MNYFILLIFAIIIIAFLVFFIRTNKKDEEKYEDEIKMDYRKPKERIKDIDIDEPMH